MAASMGGYQIFIPSIFTDATKIERQQDTIRERAACKESLGNVLAYLYCPGPW